MGTGTLHQLMYIHVRTKVWGFIKVEENGI